MGFGDAIMGSGIARGAARRGKRIAFGDGRQIIWSEQDAEVYRDNPNVAPPGSEGARDLEWVPFYTGRRFYAQARGGRWHFSTNWRPTPGEVFLDEAEESFGQAVTRSSRPVVLIEPNVKPTGACVGANKQWPVERYQDVASILSRNYHVIQMVGGQYQRARLNGIQVQETPSFRHALAVMARASLYVGPEGGLHHGAAAMSTSAVVIFGGFNSPRSTGYDGHRNLVAGGKPCGNISACVHCRQAMAAISVRDVVSAAEQELARALEEAR